MANDTLDPANPIQKYSFLANAPAGSPLSYQSLVTRRKIAEALMGKRDRLPFPKNLGEGLTYASEKLADAYGDRKLLDELDTAERRQALGEAAIRDRFDKTGTTAAGTQTGTTAATSTGVPPVPYVPSEPGSVPLPPRRPVVDRSAILDAANDPATSRQLAAITLGEGNPRASAAELRTQYQTPLDRSLATGMPLPNAIKTYTGPDSGGYYPAEAIARGEQMLQRPGAYEAFQRDIAAPVLRGADPGRTELGLPFTPTQNASLSVAERGAASGRYSQFGRSPTGELFARKPGEAQPTPFSRGGPDTDPGNTGPDIAQTPAEVAPGRDAIAAAMMPKSLAQQPLMGGTPTVPPPAMMPEPLAQQRPLGGPPVAPVQTASLGGADVPASFADRFAALPGAPGALMAGAAPMLPPGFTPPVPPGPAPVTGPGPATAALPPQATGVPAPATVPRNPVIPQPDIKTLPVQAAQAPQGLISPADVLEEGVPAPFKVQIPPHPGVEPVPPKPPPPTAAMRELSNIATGDFSEQQKLWAKGRYDELALAQSREYELAKEDYNFKRGIYATKLEAHQKGLRTLPQDQLEADLKRTHLAIAQLKTGPEVEKLRREADQIRQAMQYKAPDTLKFDNGKVGQWDYTTGTYKDITPQVNPMDIDIPEGIGKKLEFYVRAKKASSQLEGDASSLTNLASALATRKGGIFGPYVVDEKFQRDYNIAKAWGQAVLRDESGAALPEKEVERKMDTYWPMPGEGPAVIADKADRRKAEETSIYLALGKARPVANFYVERQTTKPEGTQMMDPATKKKYIVRNGLWMDVD